MINIREWLQRRFSLKKKFREKIKPNRGIIPVTKLRAINRMMNDFKRRLIVSLILTVPILLLSHHVQQFFGFHLQFPGSDGLLFLLAPQQSTSMEAILSSSA